MSDFKNIDIKAVEKIVSDWDEKKPGSRDALLKYMDDLIGEYANSDFLSQQQTINTAMKLFSSEDLAQDIKLKLAERYKYLAFGSAERFLTMLPVMVFNEIRDKVKKYASPGKYLPYEFRELNTLEIERQTDEGLRGYDMLLTVTSAFESLVKKHSRKVLAYDLKVFHGRGINEIAEMLDCSPGTVKNYVRYVGAKLKLALEGS